MSSTYRPPQWAKPAMVSITVPAGYLTTEPSNPASFDGLFFAPSASTAPTSYVFDAVLAAEHDQTLTKTHHPVQTGAAVSSHAYIEPAQLVLYVLMSDVVGQYYASAQTQVPYGQPWTGNPSKSVSAYQQVLNLQSARIPLTVTTRLRTYYNMLILKISPREDEKTITGARFRIEFEQLFVASTQAAPISARPNDTQSTGLGSVQPQTPPATINSQFNVKNTPPPAAATPTLAPTTSLNMFLPSYIVPGAGSYSSSNTNSLYQLHMP